MDGCKTPSAKQRGLARNQAVLEEGKRKCCLPAGVGYSDSAASVIGVHYTAIGVKGGGIKLLI